MTARIESLLAARVYQAPQTHGERVFFVSNLSGRLSLYAMDLAGSVPEPLLPPQIALQNPELIEGFLYHILPAHDQVLIMLDHDGDERYQPMLIPSTGGFPTPAFGDQLADYRCTALHVDAAAGLVYLAGEAEHESQFIIWLGDLAAGTLRELHRTAWDGQVVAHSPDHRQVLLADRYTIGDEVLSLWRAEQPPRTVFSTPLEQRAPDADVPLLGLGAAEWTSSGRGVLLITTLWEDTGGLGYLDIAGDGQIRPVAIAGIRHHGLGELNGLLLLEGTSYLVEFNIDGATWLYLATLDEAAGRLTLERAITGADQLAAGVIHSPFYDAASQRLVFAGSTATSPTQLYAVEDGGRGALRQLTRERVLGLAPGLLAPGEDASFTSHDGLRISARLYLPAAELGFAGRRPVVFYIHGGPQAQERPDFAWFSMPLIQLLTLNGFAVFVPNARGSTGYGLSYTKRVDRDWGGQDRLDHVHALGLLGDDPRLDTRRAGVVGRSYGGFMTLTLATRHPELWAAAVDMFGPYDLFDFMSRLPEPWKPYFAIAVGDPVHDTDLLRERSPRTYIDDLRCPLLVIQGQNDPRVTAAESGSLVETLRERGHDVEYLLFANEGHDVLKYENRVTCYSAIVEFFRRTLRPEQ